MDTQHVIKKTYCKITNLDERHNEFQYYTGLNILDKPFQIEGSCVPGGLYFTDLYNVHNFYKYGVWLRIVEIPDDSQVVQDPDTSEGIKWRSDKIILCDKYPLYDVKTIKQFYLKINEEYITGASGNGCVEVLEWWKNSGLELYYSKNALDNASWKGHIEVLEWWKNSGLKLKYSDYALVSASANGHVNVLEWWKNSGLKLKYNKYKCNGIYYASEKGHIDVLEWWKNSELKIKHIGYALVIASIESHLNVLEWWQNSGYPLKYSYDQLERVCKHCRGDIVKWWNDLERTRTKRFGFLCC